ncbi:MAG: hypothetical protein IK132_02520 [Clostridia bacterium]|nr:hypothetical protein [Clostridia bacterium]
MDRERFLNPKNEDRPYMLRHDAAEGEAGGKLDALAKAGFGGIVTNAAWHTAKGDPAFYLADDGDFLLLDRTIEAAEARGMGVWLYDEKGYPSASADGLTMLGHPEYEARGLTEIRTDGGTWVRPDTFEKIVYACRDDGSPVRFDVNYAEGADRVYVVRPVFEGSHAQKCGWGPRHYPNLMDREAVAAFLRCTYDRYYDKTARFSRFEAVFTDEPSLMSGYVNCGVPMPFVFVPWAEELPEVFRRMHGRELWDDLPVLFSREERFEEGKLRFWRTVARMTEDAYFGQIEAWCAAHGIAFSGHCLLEESLSMHVPLYGDLMRQLKAFDWPGVDMLTGSPESYWHSPADFAMAARYVGSAARMSGKTERVMVEICPIAAQTHDGDFTFAEQRGTMALLFRAGINHINSYLSHDRLGEDFPLYAAMFGRAAYWLRGAHFRSEIGVYYPIETAQGYYYPDVVGINSGASLPDAVRLAEKTLADLNRSLGAAGLDYTLIDGDWIREADLADGVLSANGLAVSALVMPAVRWLDEDVRTKLAQFEAGGGVLLWTAAMPDGIDAALTEDPAALLREKTDTGIRVEASEPGIILISPYEKDGRRFWYLVNNCPQETAVNVSVAGGPPTVWDLLTGEVAESPAFRIPAYSAVIVES